MLQQYLDLLPPDYQRVVLAAEALGGGIIDVQLTTAPLAGVFITEKAARIELPDHGERHAQSLAHEVLHIRRFWLERSPLLRNVFITGYTQLDNQLEHLFFVPELNARALADLPRHEQESQRLVAKLPAIQDSDNKSLVATIAWTVAKRTLGESPVIPQIEEALAAENAFVKADEFEQGLPKVLRSKVEVLCHLFATFPFLASPTTVIEILDVAGGTRVPLSWFDLC
jgi:hypothetical protein